MREGEEKAPLRLALLIWPSNAATQYYWARSREWNLEYSMTPSISQTEKSSLKFDSRLNLDRTDTKIAVYLYRKDFYHGDAIWN